MDARFWEEFPMLRRVLWIVAAIVGCIAIAFTSFVLWQPPPPPRPDVEPPQTIAATVPAPEPPAPPATPPTPHANTILALPKMDDAAAAATLAPTLISLDLERSDVETAFMAFSDAAKIPVTVPRGRPFNGDPPLITMHMQNQPLMEAILQIESQGFLTVVMPQPAAPAGEPLRAQFSMRRALPGLWSITGPFAFAISTINHIVTLDRQGQPAPRAGGGTGDSLEMQISMRCEPKLHILRYPMQLELSEAVDERGHSLIPAPNTPGNRPNTFNNTNFPLRATLAYPPQDAGRRIKTLRGTAIYTLQLATTTIAIDDPLHAPPAEKTINGFTASFGKFTWDTTNQSLDMTATYRRAAFTGDWTVTAQGLAGIKPRITQSTGRQALDASNASVSGDTVQAQYHIHFIKEVVNGAVVSLPGEPSVQTVSLDIPVGMVQVAVPVEFKDIPLP